MSIGKPGGAGELARKVQCVLCDNCDNVTCMTRQANLNFFLLTLNMTLYPADVGDWGRSSFKKLSPLYKKVSFNFFLLKPDLDVF